MLTYSVCWSAIAIFAAVSAGCAFDRTMPTVSESVGSVADSEPVPSAVTHSVAAVSPSDADDRLARLRDLTQRPTIDDLPVLVHALGDADFRIRRDAAGAIAMLGSSATDAVPHLAEALRDEYAFVRQRAAWALTRIGDDRAIEALRAWAHTLGPDELDHAMDALGTLEDAGSVDLIAEWMTQDDPWLRRSAARALVRIGPASAPVARDLLTHTDPDVACAAARVLGYVGDAASDLDHLTVTEHDDDTVTLCRLGARARFGDNDAVVRLGNIARDATNERAEIAVDSLAMSGSSAALNRLIDLLPHFERDDRPGNAAERALIAIGDDARAAIAVRIADVDAGSPRLQARVLAVIGDHRDLSALRQTLGSTQSDSDRRALLDAISAIEARTNEYP